MGFTVGGKLEGLEDLRSKLLFAKEKVAKKALKKGCTRASRRIMWAAKANLKERGQERKAQGGDVQGLLRKALGVIVRIYRGSMIVVAMIGPRRGFKTQVGTVTRGKRAGQPIFEDPANIAHLVEFGHGGPHPAPAHPFLRPAWDSSKAAAAQDIRDAVVEELF